MRRTRTLLAGILLAAPCALALNPALEISQYAHASWKISDGFPKGITYSIAQTPDGYLWLGTEFGLVRFDGVQHLEWAPPASEQLPSSDIRNLLVTRDGRLWIATNKGLASWKGNKLTRYGDLREQFVQSLMEDREGSVWAAVTGTPTGGLCAIRNGSVQCFGADGRFGAGVLSLYEYKGDLWAGAFTGLWRWKPDPPKRYLAPGVPLAQISDLIEGDNGLLWIATVGGIRQFVNGKFEAYPLPAGGQFTPQRLFRDREGGLWVGTAGQGLLHIHQGRTDVFTSADGLSGDSVYRVFEDREGDVWVATNGGLDRFREFAASTISVKQGLSTAAVYSVLAARDGSVWISTTDGLNRWKNGQITIYRRSGRLPTRAAQQRPVREITDDGLPGNSISSLFEDGQGRIWVSTEHGVAWFEDGRFSSVASVDSTRVRSIAEESPGSIWINDQYLGLFHLLDGRVAGQIPWARLEKKDPYPARMIADRLKGGLWIGFPQGGIAYLRDGQVGARYTADQGLRGQVDHLRLERDGSLWAATENGLCRLKDARIATLTRKNGLPCDAVHWSMEDDAGALWLNMPCGLVQVARSDLEAWAADANHTIKPAVFDSSDGVRSFSLSVGYSPRVSKSSDGKLWFDVAFGVSVIDPLHLPMNRLPPPVHVEKITADRESHDLTSDLNGRLRLPPLVRDLEIDYTALSLVAPERIRFKYKLEGHDPDWVDAGNRRHAFYNDLRPRNYRFRVMGSNNSGVWNEAGASLDFSVAPAYYQTAWFLSLCIGACLAILAAAYRLRLLYLTRQFNIRLEERVGERTRIARDLHDTLLQSFQGVLLKFSTIKYVMRSRPEEAAEELERIIEQARAAVTEGRDAVQGLRSSTVVANDLARAIATFGKGLAADHAGPDCPEFSVQVEGKSRELPPLVRDEVYRVGCESLRNAFQHAQAKRIEVEFRYDPGQFRLRIMDNGKGIDPAVLGAGGRARHHGLPGIHERAELAGGKLSVWSQIDSGTQIELTIPAAIAYPKSAAARQSMSSGTETG